MKLEKVFSNIIPGGEFPDFRSVASETFFYNDALKYTSLVKFYISRKLIDNNNCSTYQAKKYFLSNQLGNL